MLELEWLCKDDFSSILYSSLPPSLPLSLLPSLPPTQQAILNYKNMGPPGEICHWTLPTSASQLPKVIATVTSTPTGRYLQKGRRMAERGQSSHLVVHKGSMVGLAWYWEDMWRRMMQHTHLLQWIHWIPLACFVANIGSQSFQTRVRWPLKSPTTSGRAWARLHWCFLHHIKLHPSREIWVFKLGGLPWFYTG